MTVKELIKRLEGYNPDAEVSIKIDSFGTAEIANVSFYAPEEGLTKESALNVILEMNECWYEDKSY